MAARKHKAPPGLDYAPITGSRRDLSYGVVQADGDNGINTAEAAVFRRLYPILKPADPTLPWEQPTCFRHEVLLPRGVSDEYWDPQHLARAYDRQGFCLRDLLVVLTLRFPEVDVRPPLLTLHEAWERARSFAMGRLVTVHGVAAICVMHVPRRASRSADAHVHVLLPPRELLPSGFGSFVRALIGPDARELMDNEWAEWAEKPHGQ
jgi:hypothetical protein